MLAAAAVNRPRYINVRAPSVERPEHSARLVSRRAGTKGIIPNSLHSCYRGEPVPIHGPLLSWSKMYHERGDCGRWVARWSTIKFYKERNVITKYKRLPDGTGRAITTIEIIELSDDERQEREKMYRRSK
jgi:hypothetical protein